MSVRVFQSAQFSPTWSILRPNADCLHIFRLEDTRFEQFVQGTTDFASPGVHLPVGLPYVRSKLEGLCRNDGSVTKQLGVWIMTVTIVEKLRQGLESPRRVGIDESIHGYGFVRWVTFDSG